MAVVFNIILAWFTKLATSDVIHIHWGDSIMDLEGFNVKVMFLPRQRRTHLSILAIILFHSKVKLWIRVQCASNNAFFISLCQFQIDYLQTTLKFRAFQPNILKMTRDYMFWHKSHTKLVGRFRLPSLHRRQPLSFDCWI